MKKLILVSVVVLLFGCGQEQMVEPNVATCAPNQINKSLNEMRSEANRKAFIQECKSFEKAKEMKQWEFKPSGPSKY